MAKALVLPPHRTTVTIKQACALAGVSRRTIYNWMDKDKVAFCRVASGSRRVYLDTLFQADLDQPGEAEEPAESGA